MSTPKRQQWLEQTHRDSLARQLSNYEVVKSGCWIWQGAVFTYKNKLPYGQSRKNGKPITAHRLFYQEHTGPVPDGVCVLHKCDNPRCVNPEHLFLGTNLDNTRDMIAKGRQGFRNDTIYITHNGITKPLSYWAELLGTRPQNLHARLQRGWSHERTVTQPSNYSISQLKRYENLREVRSTK